MSKADFFLNKTLGEDFTESLVKAEIWKPGTKSVNDLEDMRIGLKIVPRTIMSFLIRELSSMEIGDNKRISLPVADDASMNVTKHERDQYSGEIDQAGKKITEFKFRSLPGVGLVLMSTFELYSVDDLDKKSASSEDIDSKVQKLIDERLALHDLIERVVDKKLMQKDAVNSLVLRKLTEELEKEKASKPNESKEDSPIEIIEKASELNESKEDFPIEIPKKGSPVKEFLQKRQSKKEFSFQMAKGESVNCPDCNKEIFNKTGFSGCICYGPDMDKKVFIKKTENGIKVSFPKSWDIENIEMLLEVLQKKNR